MEFVKPGLYVDFMKYRVWVVGVSLTLVALSVASLFYPGPNFGIDFRGGTELQLRFKADVSPGELRKTLESLSYDRPEVVGVQGSKREYMIRVSEVSSLPIEKEKSIKRAVKGIGDLERFKVSPGGEKITLRFRSEVRPEVIRDAIISNGVKVRRVNRFGKIQDFRYEAHLTGVGDTIVEQLSESFGTRGPETLLRVEWVGPKAGAQLRDAAIRALLYAVAFIMLYVAFRFDLRFAPGGVLAMVHDVLITMGIYVVFQREVTLTTIAALLTIMGYSINDTIVVFDRIRENMARSRDKNLFEVINLSTSQMLSRTMVTSGTTLLSVMAFFIFGTSVIKDIAFAMMIGILVGTFSSIYIAAPATEWMDRKFFRRARKR